MKPRAINDPTPAPLMALWFSAGWCPDCVEFLPFVESFTQFQDKEAPDSPMVRFVYVSSDTSEEELNSFKPSTMAHVPFENHSERENMKRHFGVCAAKERETLGMTPEQRKYGIPTVLLLDTNKGNVLYSEATKDLEKIEASQVYNKWKTLVLPLAS